MSTDSLLRDRLKSFLDQQEQTAALNFRDDFVCPESLLSMQSEFPSFEWFIAADTDPFRPTVLGIRKLVDQSPFRLSDLRARGFRTESIRHPIRPPVKGIVEHYLLAELVSSAEAKVSLCMHVAPDEWYVLDEHRVIRA